MIDEKELIEEIKSLRVTITGLRAGKGILNEYAQHFKDSIIKIIDEQPRVNEWISAEQMPKDLEEVLVWFEYFRYGEYNCLYQTYGISYALNGEWSCIINGSTGWRDLKIIAWMPLPRPYMKVR